ncbi:hypothetical protein C8R48DRAFT_780584 [Suillus tomentosus]|nr:hypothetical protein C8R48DRAFT_780584 [Suillus tomentosus]
MFCILKDVFRIASLIEHVRAQSDDDSNVDDAYNTLLSNIPLTLLKVMKHVLTGPSSALAGDDFHVSNSCNAVIHGIMTVEAENIAYAAIQAHSAITSHDKWTAEDGKFSYQKFYYRIIDVICNPPDKAWAAATLQHCNLKLFKDKAGRTAALSTSATSDDGDLDKDEDDVALMHKQFALRSANIASTVKPAAPLPSSINSEVLPPRLCTTHKDPSLSASFSPTLHSSSPSPLASKPHLNQPVASQVQAPCSPAAAPPALKPHPVVATAPSTSKSHPVHTAPSEASMPPPRKKQKLTQPESPLTESEAEEVETPVQKSP